jgi:hypothetical protein
VVPRDPEGNLIKELVPFTRASTLGGAIEYQGGLHRWKAAVVAWAIARHRTLAKRARAIAGYSRRDDKDELYEIIDQADTWAESNSKANHGTALHSLFRRIAEGATVADLIADATLNPAEEDDRADIAACEAFADAITRWTVVWAERRVVCDEAQAAGKYDLIVTPRRPMPVTDADGKVVDVIMPGDMVVVDNKTSGTADYFGEKFAVQLWIYANGRDYDRETGERTEVGVRKDWALILHIPSDDESVVATWHWVDLSAGERLVKIARDVMEGRKMGKRAIRRADLDAEIPPELLARAQSVQAGGESVVALGKELEPEAPAAVRVCRCVTPTCPECLHIPGCVDADDPRAWCECEDDETCTGPCRQHAHFPAKCPGSGKTYAPPAETTEARFRREEAQRLAVKKAKEEVMAEQAAERDALPGELADRADALIEAAERDALSQPEEAAETLAQRLQKAAAANAAVPDAERARAYLIAQLEKATTEATIVDLWKRASKKGYWARDDAELNALGAEARRRVADLEPVQ